MSHPTPSVFGPEFMKILVHDLRAHIRAVNSLSEIVIEESVTQISSESMSFLRKIGTSVGSLAELTDHLSDIVSIEQYEDRIIELNLRSVVDRIVRDYKWGQRIDLRSDLLVPLNTNPGMVSLVVRELLKNAVLYSTGLVRCTIKPNDRSVVIAIEDHGIGIPPASLHRVFDPFYRLHSSSTYPGSGLGLFKAQLAANRLGAEIALHSDPNVSTTATLVLPQIQAQ